MFAPFPSIWIEKLARFLQAFRFILQAFRFILQVILQDESKSLQESCKWIDKLARFLQVKRKTCNNLASNLVPVCIHLQDCFQVAWKFFNSAITRDAAWWKISSRFLIQYYDFTKNNALIDKLMVFQKCKRTRRNYFTTLKDIESNKK